MNHKWICLKVNSVLQVSISISIMSKEILPSLRNLLVTIATKPYGRRLGPLKKKHPKNSDFNLRIILYPNIKKNVEQ